VFSSVRSAGNGIAFLIGAASMAEFVAKACSSPQTLETNATKRAPTMWKWVNLGILEGSLLVAASAALDKKYAFYLLAGGAFEGAITYAEYWHGKQSGLASSEPETEDDSSGSANQW
jgi:hypothetical protein